MAKQALPALIIAGFGSQEALQLTLEVQQLCVRAGRALTLGLPPRLSALLKRQGVAVTELDDALDGKDFPASYAVIAETVLRTAEADPPAVFLAPGTPLLLNAVSRYLLVEAKKRKLSVVVLPGVSMFDAVIADLGIDVAGAGLQTISARGLVANPRAANRRTPLLLLEAGAASTDEGFRELVQTLRALYPDNQPVTTLRPATSGLSRTTVTLGKFAPSAAELQWADALFIDVARGLPAAGESG